VGLNVNAPEFRPVWKTQV
jgi:hypothetical protein